MMKLLYAVMALFPLALAGQLSAQSGSGYQIGVVSESGDRVTWLRFSDGALSVLRVVPVGVMPTEIDGPHNLAVAPDQTAYYITIAHGTPYGSLWKLDAATDTVLGRAPLEMFPTTIGLTPGGELALVANSDFYGDHPRVNPVTVIYTPTMTPVTDIQACDMPHGVKVNHAGTLAYVSCMHSDELLEIDLATLAITRRVSTGGGAAVPMAGMGHGDIPANPHPDESCQPTFVSVSPDDRTLYAACNHSGTLQAWDAATLTRTGQVAVGAGAYNVEPSPDGALVIVTNKKAQSISLVDAATLTELARIPVTKKVVHGVAYAPDGRYAFISQESIGADSGAVDVIDLAARKDVGAIAVPGQPTGIAILRRN
jgi:YVTN family beta-propeller protein